MADGLTTIACRPITETLKSMEVGQTELFSMKQANSVYNSISQRVIMERLQGWRFKTSKDWDNGVIRVTRVS